MPHSVVGRLHFEYSEDLRLGDLSCSSVLFIINGDLIDGSPHGHRHRYAILITLDRIVRPSLISEHHPTLAISNKVRVIFLLARSRM